MVKPDRIVLPADPNDPEDFDVTAEGLERGLRARTIRMTRTKLGLSQPEFAARFRVPVGTLRDWEQARVMPPDFAVAYVRVIGLHPDLVTKALQPEAA
jgi:putative transcriptional regulator